MNETRHRLPMILFLSVLSVPLDATTLNLNQYLAQVRESHLGFKAAQTRSKSFELESRVGRIALSPYLLGSAKWVDDSSPNSNPAILGDQTQQKSYSLGLGKLFSSGTQTKALYHIESTDIIGSASVTPNYYQNSLGLELTQPLWRNFFGSETRAMIHVAEAEKLEIGFSERYRMKQLLATAELMYWKAFAAQRVFKVRETSRDRAQKLTDWSSERVRLHLADRSDLLQSQAALKGRELELRASRDDFNSACISLNSMRGIETPEVPEVLVGLKSPELDQLEPPVRASLRDDVYAAQQRKRQAESNAQFSLEKGKPSLELSGSLNFAGRNAKMSKASSDSFSKEHPTVAIGVTLNAPLDFWAARDLRDGALASQRAAEMDYQRKLFEQEREWADLSSQFQAKKDQLHLARDLEQVQSAKLMAEQERLKRGRTTTFQVLVFEQDYAAARLTLISTETQLLTLRTQMKTFGDSAVTIGGTP